MSVRSWAKAWGVFLALSIIALLVVGLTSVGGSSNTSSAVSHPTTPSSTPSTTASCSTWKMQSATPANGRWEENGVPAIKNAHTKAQARQAAFDWLRANEGNPGLLAGTAAYLLNKQVDPATLVHNGCATPAAVRLTQELSAALALADVSPSQAPADGINTFTSDGKTYAEAASGISGDRKAVMVVTRTGMTFWVMARCGNPVTRHHTPLPRHHPPKKHHGGCTGKTCTPTHVCTLKPKPGFIITPQCTYYKPPQTFNCQQNGSWTNNCPPNQVDQPVQDNPCCDTGNTPGAGSEPSPNPTGPTPSSGSPAPPPNSDGYDSGSSDGSGTPGGTTCDSSGCSGGGSTSGSGPTDTSNSGDNNGTDGSGNSTGGGDPGNPFG